MSRFRYRVLNRGAVRLVLAAVVLLLPSAGRAESVPLFRGTVSVSNLPALPSQAAATNRRLHAVAPADTLKNDLFVYVALGNNISFNNYSFMFSAYGRELENYQDSLGGLNYSIKAMMFVSDSVALGVSFSIAQEYMTVRAGTDKTIDEFPTPQEYYQTLANVKKVSAQHMPCLLFVQKQFSRVYAAGGLGINFWNGNLLGGKDPMVDLGVGYLVPVLGIIHLDINLHYNVIFSAERLTMLHFNTGLSLRL